MTKKLASIFSVLIILVFLIFMIFDTMRPERIIDKDETENVLSIPDAWKLDREFVVSKGTLQAVAVSPEGKVLLGTDSSVFCYNKELRLIWELKTEYPVTSLAVNGDSIFASSLERILIISGQGKLKDEWGPFEDNSIITSVSANNNSVAFADAGNKAVFILDKSGRVQNITGLNDDQFIIPSPYFDVALNAENDLFIGNTGHRRIETRTIEGELKNYFGEPGTAPGAFCGCCNPAHFITIPHGFVTAEKGINRIKILNRSGEFVEYVSSRNKFMRSVPLDLASADGVTIYAANPADSKLYIFKRK